MTLAVRMPTPAGKRRLGALDSGDAQEAGANDDRI
jgi:hypothetical protein